MFLFKSTKLSRMVESLFAFSMTVSICPSEKVFSFANQKTCEQGLVYCKFINGWHFPLQFFMVKTTCSNKLYYTTMKSDH